MMATPNDLCNGPIIMITSNKKHCVIVYCIAREKTLVELELQENWQRKLWRLAEAKSIQYLRSQDLTTFGRLAMN